MCNTFFVVQLLYSICISFKLGKVKQIEKQVVTDLAQHPCQIMVQNNQLSKYMHDIGRLLYSIWLSFAPYLVQLDNK